MYAQHRDIVPEVATRKGICGDWRCMQEIVRGDIVVVYPDAPEKPQHVAHWLDQLRGDLGREEQERDRYQRVAHEVLQFCAGLSAVSPDWIGQQYRYLAGHTRP